MKNRWPNDETEARVRAALDGPGNEVLRTIVVQPKRSWSNKHLVNSETVIPVPR